MGINISEIKQCSKCDCSIFENFTIKKSYNTKIKPITKKERTRNSKHKDYAINRFFTNDINNYLNDDSSDNSISNPNNNINTNTYRSTNIHTNSTRKNNNIENMNNILNNNINLNKNNVTIEKKDKSEEHSSIYSNQDSFIKMEEKQFEIVKNFDQTLNQVSVIEISIENKEKSQTNLDLDNANIEDLMNIIEKKNVENEGTIIEFNGERCIFKGQLEDKKNISGKGKMYYKDGNMKEFLKMGN